MPPPCNEAPEPLSREVLNSRGDEEARSNVEMPLGYEELASAANENRIRATSDNCNVNADNEDIGSKRAGNTNDTVKIRDVVDNGHNNIAVDNGRNNYTVFNGSNNRTELNGDNNNTVTNGSSNVTVTNGNNNVTVINGSNKHTVINGDNKVTVVNLNHKFCVIDGDYEVTVLSGDD